MKITIEIDEKYSDTEIRVGCRRLTPELEKMIAMLRMLEMQLTVEKDGVTYLLDGIRCCMWRRWRGKPLCTRMSRSMNQD